MQQAQESDESMAHQGNASTTRSCADKHKLLPVECACQHQEPIKIFLRSRFTVILKRDEFSNLNLAVLIDLYRRDIILVKFSGHLANQVFKRCLIRSNMLSYHERNNVLLQPELRSQFFDLIFLLEG